MIRRLGRWELQIHISGIFIIMFSVISSGMVAVMTQNIGAGRPGVAYQARQLGLAFNAVLGIIMSLFLSLGAGDQFSLGSVWQMH